MLFSGHLAISRAAVDMMGENIIYCLVVLNAFCF